MNINPTQNFSNNLSGNPQFKAAYPVVHWVRETNGSYAPAISEDLNRKLQRILVRMLNNQGNNTKPDKLHFMNYVKQIVSKADSDYAKNPTARSFYDISGGWGKNKFEPIGYILTGKHADHMQEMLGKPIGRAKNDAPRSGSTIARTAEVNIALHDYFQSGLNYVRKLASKFKDKKNTHYGLHTKFEVVRNKNGKIKEYRLEDIKFCPEEGDANPFVRTGYITS